MTDEDVGSVATGNDRVVIIWRLGYPYDRSLLEIWCLDELLMR